MEKLIEMLRNGGHSLVIDNGTVSTFDGRGVSDLYRLLETAPIFLKGALVADKVVGKAAAALMALAKVKEVYAEVISRPALELLESNRIKATYGEVVPNIINRTGTGICPLETRCMGCVTLADCFMQILVFMEEMKNNKK